MDPDGEQDGGGRVYVSMSRMTVARGSVSMSRTVHLLVRGLCGREVRLQGKAESAPQARNFKKSVSTHSRGWPVRAHTRTGDSRNRVSVSVGGQGEVTVHVDQSLFARQTVKSEVFCEGIFSS